MKTNDASLHGASGPMTISAPMTRLRKILGGRVRLHGSTGLVLAASLLASACATDGQDMIPATPTRPASPAITDQLSDAAQRASKAFATMAAVEKARFGEDEVCSVSCMDFPNELRREIVMPWTGPIEPALERLAGELGYQFSIIGQRPAAPLLVTLRDEPVPIYRAFEEISWQSSRRASVAVNPTRMYVELRYVAR